MRRLAGTRSRWPWRRAIAHMLCSGPAQSSQAQAEAEEAACPSLAGDMAARHHGSYVVKQAVRMPSTIDRPIIIPRRSQSQTIRLRNSDSLALGPRRVDNILSRSYSPVDIPNSSPV
ncbi:hypothetical protein L226DRAFT_201748 [Lentinus tigrinus ALCF2SS1-7]|uniref:uncharacterized protein n=1 Tax=Lentinus tigrinus ALCF2SS1-7 TaxID=1328758 RepID=UPI001165EC14|nr:hypothetical protein L226DRAFT_201748 [Lentinus tigrinus ALCF2SS1-7]